MPGLVPGIHILLLRTEEKGVDGRDKPGHDDDYETIVESNQHRAASPTISGCRASATAGDIRITNAWTPKIATAR
jgi:hypothetical protein